MKVYVDKDEYWPFYERAVESWEACYAVELTETEIAEWDNAQEVLTRIFQRITEQLEANGD